MSIITRFAPSPTGYLHVGNVRTALINWLFAKNNQGKFMLRMDDTDLIRSKDIYADQIINDMKWLGLNWDIFARQSDRLNRYDVIKNKLIADGRLYPCFETQEEIDIKRKMQLKQKNSFIYDRAALRLSKYDIDKYIENGVKPHYRFLLNNSRISWNDRIREEVEFDAKNFSDPIVIREDQTMTYILTSVIDDIDFSITDIIRGEDHISNTAIQIQIFESLNAEIPNFAHLARIKSMTAEISKRTGGYDIMSLKQEYIEPMSIHNLFARIGSSNDLNIVSSLEELSNEFSISKFSRAPSNYDPDDLTRINHKLISNYSYQMIKSRLDELGIKEIDEEFWLKTRNNINNIDEIKIWFNICKKELKPILTDQELINIAASELPNGNFDETTWQEWITKIKLKTDKKGKDLFMPIRFCLTGLDHGPELKLLLPLIGKEKVIKRLNGLKS